jgi:hypothetical protein
MICVVSGVYRVWVIGENGLYHARVKGSVLSNFFYKTHELTYEFKRVRAYWLEDQV